MIRSCGSLTAVIGYRAAGSRSFSVPAGEVLGYTDVGFIIATCQEGDMRRLTVEEELLKDRPVLKEEAAICALCGAELEVEEESGEYRCPICDNDAE